jgi:hypothetical protein
MMKLSDGKFGVEMLHRMLHLLMVLQRGKSHMYIHSMIMQLLILLHQRSKDTCAWKMLMGSLSTFNEEAGELSFSMLARCILGDTQKRKFAHLNKIYQQIHFYGSLEKELGADGAGFNKNGNWRKKLDPEGDLVIAVTAHMNSVIRQIRMRCFHVYSGKPRTWRDMGPARDTLVKVSNPIPLWVADMGAELDRQLQKCQDKFSTFWVEPYKNMWPEFAHRPEMVQLLPHGVVIIGPRARPRQPEPEDLLVDGDWQGEPAVGPNKGDPKRRRKKRKPKRSKRKIGDVAESGDDSDVLYAASESSDEPQDSVPPPTIPDEDDSFDETLPQHNDLFGAHFADVDEANIRSDRPRQRVARHALG